MRHQDSRTNMYWPAHKERPYVMTTPQKESLSIGLTMYRMHQQWLFHVHVPCFGRLVLNVVVIVATIGRCGPTARYASAVSANKFELLFRR